MAAIDFIHSSVLSTYGNSISPTKGSKYDAHKPEQLRDTSNRILKANKDTPLYKLKESGDLSDFAIDVKSGARDMSRVIASLSEGGDDISSVLSKKIAFSTNEDSISVDYVGEDSESDVSGFTMNVISLAKPQVNEGNFLKKNDHQFEAGNFSFDLETPNNAYEFQFSVSESDTNFDVQQKIARLINQSDVGLNAQLIENDESPNFAALRITSKQTGLTEEEESLFNITTTDSYNELKLLGISSITSPATNSSFELNGKEHSSLSNTFTINRAFEVTLKAPTEGEETVGFRTNSSALGDGIRDMISTYNNLVDVGIKHNEVTGNNAFLSDVTLVSKTMGDDLANVGINTDENGKLSFDRDRLDEAVNSDKAPGAYATLNKFKNMLSRTADNISFNPIKYVDKVVVEYKNPGRSFNAPYAPNAYSGLMVDRAL